MAEIWGGVNVVKGGINVVKRGIYGRLRPTETKRGEALDAPT